MTPNFNYKKTKRIVRLEYVCGAPSQFGSQKCVWISMYING